MRQRTRRRLPQPRHGASPASHPGPTDPALRANPYPEVTGSDLPTSLTYLDLTCQRLFTLETCCGYGYGPGARLTPSPPDFQGPTRAHRDAARGATLSRGAGPSLGANPFQGALPFHKKRELLPGAPASFSGIVCR
uniref:Uncharacterized protein n=1 Tax=Gasterosteus aculeatus aculeatus TaxID=481459 RepID=A0AAQ4R668_GASAC